ncbi:MAG TPA: short-chain dehydrogenase [Gammaproteobacteria bacterium]|nr:short-chain dehydrogenase [Gammaproteobacteria bacterium]HAU06469.1 short-chain dehydrogenase [Gammaproteobacteria bacterium]
MIDIASKQVVLITGAGRRVGNHLAQRLHQQGYHVVAHYRSETEQLETLKAMGIDTLQADLDSAEQAISFAKVVSERYPRFRALIHNASSFSPTATDLMAAAKQYQQFFTIHMLAPYLMNEVLLAQLHPTGQQWGDIIHITDIHVENPSPEFEIYSSTKAGLHNLTLGLAKKYAPAIKVNAIAPGPVLFAQQHDKATIDEILAETLLAKEGGAEPVYLAVKSLLENPFITGCSLPVDGGRRLTKR